VTLDAGAVDRLASRVSGEAWSEKAARLKVTADTPVFVAGSTHEGEESIVLRIYRELLRERPGLRLILVPRHPERGPAVRDLAAQEGHACILMSEIRAGRVPRDEVVVVDVIGELFGLYSLATAVFCGGASCRRGARTSLTRPAWGDSRILRAFHGGTSWAKKPFWRKPGGHLRARREGTCSTG
jgi:3-deoxy-D-manno-octulosonic-acid transferase